MADKSLPEDPYYIVNGQYQSQDGTLLPLCPACRDDGVDDTWGHDCKECNRRVCPNCWADTYRMNMCFECAMERGLYKPFKCACCEETDPREKWEYDCVVCRRELCDTCFEDKGNPAFDACEDCIRRLIIDNTKNV